MSAKTTARKASTSADVELDELLACLAQRQDPPFDDVVAAELGRDSDGDVLRALIKKSETYRAGERSGLPILDDEPELDFADWNRVARGQKFFQHRVALFGWALFSASLPEGYLYPGPAAMLRLTGKLDDAATIDDRVRRTADWLYHVMTPGSLEPRQLGTGRGWREARLIRLRHAMARYEVQAKVDGALAHEPFDHHRKFVSTGDASPADDPYWLDSWVVLNQRDMLGTLLTFTTIPVRSMKIKSRSARVHPSTLDHFAHAWLVIAELLGIPTSNLRNYATVRGLSDWQLLEAIHEIEADRPDRGVNADGRKLLCELIEMLDQQHLDRSRFFGRFTKRLNRASVEVFAKDAAPMLPPTEGSRLTRGLPITRLLVVPAMRSGLVWSTRAVPEGSLLNYAIVQIKGYELRRYVESR